MGEHKQYNLSSRSEKPVLPQSDFISSPNVTRTDKTLVVKDFFIANDTEVQMLKGQKFNRLAVTSTTGNSVFSIAVVDYLIGVTSLADAPTVGLPRPKFVGVGKTYIVKDESGGASSTTITVVSSGEETIDGATSATITSNYDSRVFYTDGTNWFII